MFRLQMEEPSNRGSAEPWDAFETYLTSFLHGSRPAVCIYLCDILVQYAFHYQIGNYIRFAIFCVSSGDLRGVPVGLIPVGQDLLNRFEHDRPDPPPTITVSSLLKVFLYYLLSAQLFFDLSGVVRLFLSSAPALVLSFPTHLVYAMIFYHLTGIGRRANDFFCWIMFKMGSPRVFLFFTLAVVYLRGLLRVRSSAPICNLVALRWPGIEPTCSKIPLVFMLLVIAAPLTLVRPYWQLLKIPYWQWARTFNEGCIGTHTFIWLGQPEFEYKPLEPGFIRVLDVLPTSRTSNSPIRTKLRHIRLEDAKYDAISYTWGHPAQIQGILISGKWFPLTENAFEVIADRAFPLGTRTIWIDCICINQRDDHEKARQVSLMSEIYRRANRTIIWLGNFPDAMPAFSLVEDIARRVPQRGVVPFFGAQTGLIDKVWGWLFERRDRRDPRFEVLARLLGHPYFRRVWIIQEVTFSRQIHIRGGTCWIDWATFEWAVFLLLRPQYRRLVGKDIIFMQVENPAVLTQIETLVSLRNKILDSTPADRLPLSSLLSEGFVAQASDERDYVYGILSLSRAADDPAMAPDYTVDAAEGFRKTARYLLATSDLEEVLYSAGIGYRRAIYGIPSWITDWSCWPQVNRLRKKGVATYNASNGRPLEIHEHNDDTITLRGNCFDRILTLCSREIPADNVNMQSPEAEALLLRWAFQEVEA